jgi:hypothetical protein
MKSELLPGERVLMDGIADMKKGWEMVSVALHEG